VEQISVSGGKFPLALHIHLLPGYLHAFMLPALAVPLTVTSSSNSPPMSSLRYGARSAGHVRDDIRTSRLLIRLVRQTHHERQGDVESSDIFVVEMADPRSNSLPPNRHGLVGHNLRSDS
jgi:hypothetical protein